MAALTVKLDTIYEVGNDYHGYGTVTLGTYAPGGDTVTIQDQDAGHEAGEWIRQLKIELPGYVGQWVRSSQKHKLYLQKDPAAAGGADIALPEVGAVDLSANTNLAVFVVYQ